MEWHQDSMKALFSVVAAIFAGAALLHAAETNDSRVYEMRVYYAAKGKLDDLNKRFRHHTLKLFEKHGMENIGYWVPIENPENKLIYVLAHKSREEAMKSWRAFSGDAEWNTARKASEKDGKLVDKVERYFMLASDFSPTIKTDASVLDTFSIALNTARILGLSPMIPSNASKSRLSISSRLPRSNDCT